MPMISGDEIAHLSFYVWENIRSRGRLRSGKQEVHAELVRYSQSHIMTSVANQNQ